MNGMGAITRMKRPACDSRLTWGAKEGSELSIAFDHTLSDSEDAHRTLVAMLRAMPQPGNAD